MMSPPHPGQYVQVDYLRERGLSITEGTKVLGVSRQAQEVQYGGQARTAVILKRGAI